jgi:NitT/TauT family transport system substrate-binding protein
MTLTRSRSLQLLGGAIAAPLLRSPARAADLPAVKLGMIPIEATCLAYYAKENGYFDKAGLNVEIDVNPSTSSIAAAIVTGTYDIGYSTVSTLAEAHVKGLPYVIIAADGVALDARPTGGLVLPMNSTIKTGKDFNGKIFGTSGLNTLAEYLPRAWVDQHGGDSSTMKFIEVPFPAMGDALVAGRVDAGYLVEPFITITKNRNTARFFVTGYEAIAPISLSGVWYATGAWAKAHPDVVARFASAMGEAARWANANPAKVVPIIVNRLNADPAVTAAATRTLFGDRVLVAQIQPWIDVTAKYAKFAPFPAADIIFTPGRLSH